MSLGLPGAPGAYDQKNEQDSRRLLEEADRFNFKKGQDVRLVRDERFSLRSPDGTEWFLTIDNAGVATWSS